MRCDILGRGGYACTEVPKRQVGILASVVVVVVVVVYLVTSRSVVACCMPSSILLARPCLGLGERCVDRKAG